MTEHPSYHHDAEQFRQALSYTQTDRGFSARLIEKDYYCSVVLHDLLPLFETGLIFKGGTSLSKVHADFYRLSEDLDFVFDVPPDAARSARRELIKPVKEHLEALPQRLPFFLVPEPLAAHNQSTQYIGTIRYRSCLTDQEESIKVEIGLREPVLQPQQRRLAQTMLINPSRQAPAINPVSVEVLSLLETYAEKIRAALSRRIPAIRDFFDIDYAIRADLLSVHDPTLIDLVARKLDVSGADSMDITQQCLKKLQLQLQPQLRPVLNNSDFNTFDLDRAFQCVCDLHSRLSLS